MTVTKWIRGRISPFAHYMKYRNNKPPIQFTTGIFILSLDVDVGSPQVGVVNEGRNDQNVHDEKTEQQIGEIEEIALPLITACLNQLEMPATYAVRGQLLDIETSILNLLQDSPVPHDIGAHGYSHRTFTSLNEDQARTELQCIAQAFQRQNMTVKSFIFPKNMVHHLDVLAEYKYLCYRAYGDLNHDDRAILKTQDLYDIHPSLYLGDVTTTYMIKKIIDVSVRDHAVLHFWLHPWNMGETETSITTNIKNILAPILQHAQTYQRQGALQFETMRSVAEKLDANQLPHTLSEP
jgi:peptidoglycan/xylan/chitin deacetylase (PgdA/CDA1 family)